MLEKRSHTLPSGESTSGDFIWSLTATDIFSGWTELRAVSNKGAHGVCTQIEAVEKALPFVLPGFDCDNGSEFLNHHLWSYFGHGRRGVDFTRSRPYRKNDNAHVEQKNWTHVRCLLGYERLEAPAGSSCTFAIATTGIDLIPLFSTTHPSPNSIYLRTTS